MHIKDLRDTYYFASGKASDVARQLALAGIALIWIFKLDSKDPFAVPAPLWTPAALFVLGLAFDLVQYILSTVIWGWYNRYHEVKLRTPEEREFKAPRYLNWPTLLMFWLKLALVLMAYGFTFAYIVGHAPSV